MSEVNAAPVAEPVKITSKLTPAKIREIYERLSAPFDPEDVKWLPQSVDWKNKTAIAAAYADPRAYEDRLNETVGVDNWSQTAVLSYSPAYDKHVKGKKVQNPDTQQWEETPSTIVKESRISAVVTVTINGLGSKTQVGEAEASDENATTSAFAQGMKRACSQFGLGRYFYDFPKTRCDYDTYNKHFKTTPALPDFAIPKNPCSDCKANITPIQIGKETYTVKRLIAGSLEKYNRQLCAACGKAAAKKLKDAAGANIGVGRAAAAA